MLIQIQVENGWRSRSSFADLPSAIFKEPNPYISKHFFDKIAFERSPFAKFTHQHKPCALGVLSGNCIHPPIENLEKYGYTLFIS